MNANDAWIKSLKEVYEYGTNAQPRGYETKEWINHFSYFDMNSPICYHQDRKLNYSFMAAEAYWITSGSMFVEDIAPYNKHISQFSDDGYIFNGAYGPRFTHQFEHVVRSLVEDSFSRQAVITIWTPNPIKTKDYPCTLNLQWLIRHGKLHCIVNMRSNDLWLGRPYDFFNFTVMSMRILCAINERTGNEYSLGMLYTTVGSLHQYKKDEEKIIKVIENEANKKIDEVPHECTHSWQFVVESLLACRDKIIKPNLWMINPCL